MRNAENKDMVGETFRRCIDAIGDVDYCASLVDAILHVATRRVFTYGPEGRSRPVFYLLLPNVDYKAGILTDVSKKSFIILLHGPRHVVSLVYEKDDGGFALRKAVVSNAELLALLNGPLGQTDNFEVGGL